MKTTKSTPSSTLKRKVISLSEIEELFDNGYDRKSISEYYQLPLRQINLILNSEAAKKRGISNRRPRRISYVIKEETTPQVQVVDDLVSQEDQENARINAEVQAKIEIVRGKQQQLTRVMADLQNNLIELMQITEQATEEIGEISE